MTDKQPSKPFHEMTDAELTAEYDLWKEKIGAAPGPSSAFFAADMLQQVTREGRRRNLQMFLD